jgi:hypothetical protein
MDKRDRNELDNFTPDRRHDSRAYTDDRDVADTFDESLDRAGVETGSREMLKEESLEQGLDLRMAAGDIDQATRFVELTDASTVGQEAVGGAQQPPDQSSVDDIGREVGIEYQDNEPLEVNRKIRERDLTERWELNPASSDDWPRQI